MVKVLCKINTTVLLGYFLERFATHKSADGPVAASPALALLTLPKMWRTTTAPRYIKESARTVLADNLRPFASSDVFMS